MGVVIRQSLKGTFVNYVGVVLGIFVSFFCQTKWLDPSVIGLQKVVYEAALLLGTLALLGAGSTGMRFFPFFKDKESGNHGFFYYYLLMPLVGIPAMLLFYLLLQEPIESYFSKNSPQFNEFFYYVMPLMVVLAFWSWWEYYANIHMRIAIPKAVREVGMRLFMIVIYLSYHLELIGVRGLIVSFIVAYSVCMMITGCYTMHIGETSMKHDWSFITPELKSKVLRYSGFLMLATISGNIMNQLDLWMLTGVKGLYEAGVYTIVVYMAEVVNMPSRNITPISAPLAAEAMKEGNVKKAEELYKQVSVHQTLASAVLLLLIWINLDNIFEILPNGDKYAVGKWAILCLGLAKVIYGALSFGNTLISFSKYYYWTLVVTIVLTGFTIATNLYFIPLFGIVGAAMATLLTCVLSYGYQQYLVQVKIKTNPFCWAHLRIVLLIVLLFGLNALLPSLTMISPWLDLVLRSCLFSLGCSVIVYALKISPQVNWFIDEKVLKRFS